VSLWEDGVTHKLFWWEWDRVGGGHTCWSCELYHNTTLVSLPPQIVYCKALLTCFVVDIKFLKSFRI
jgi:hypothetical protein